MKFGAMFRAHGSIARGALVPLALAAVAACTPHQATPSIHDGTPERTAIEATIAQLCVSCHGEQGISPVPLFPNLAGQDVDYLYNQLLRFKSGALTDSPMTAVASLLDGSVLRSLATHYAEMRASTTAAPVADQSMFERGATLFREGLASAGVPPCQTCHGQNGEGMGVAAPIQAVPRLRHQKAEYLSVRLRAYRAGTLGSSAEVGIMQGVASGLDDASITALATWIASAP